jgi:hypothetical protein
VWDWTEEKRGLIGICGVKARVGLYVVKVLTHHCLPCHYLYPRDSASGFVVSACLFITFRSGLRLAIGSRGGRLVHRIDSREIAG